MVSFGPWLEEPDWYWVDQYVASDPTRAESLMNTVNDSVGPLEGDGSGVPPYLITMSDIGGTVSTAQDVNQDAYGDMVYSWDYDFSSPNWTAEWSARAFDIRWQVSPPPEGFYFSEGVADPEDAIGIQYEGRPWDPADPWSDDVDTNLGPEFIVGATLGSGSFNDQTELRGDFEDDSGQIDGYTTDDLTQTSITHIMAEGATLETVATVEVEPSPGAKVVGLPAPGVFDLTGVLEPNGWACQLYCQTPLIPPRRPPDTVPISFGNVRYGVKLQVVQIKWQVRALRYRWVYATTPYRRIYPRDDGLGGGAPRTYPPSKSVQLGNRTTGGYL